jgi:DNA-binding transcriptional ArsR family regulator
LIRLRLTAEDLARIQVASTLGPFAEAFWAAELIRRRSPGPAHHLWRQGLHGQLNGDTRALAAFFPVAAPPLDLPTLVGRVHRIDEGTEALMSLGRQHLRDEIAWLSRHQPLIAWPWTRLDTDLDLRRQLGAAISSFHAVAVAPHWARMSAFLHAEQARQIRHMATAGIEEFLARLCPPLIRWRAPVLEIERGSGQQEQSLRGRGLVIVPSVFCGPGPCLSYDLADADAPLILVYPALRDPSAAARLWTGKADGDALADLLGRTRSATLAAIVDGCGTVELALRVGISPAAASQHTAVLRRAGLITTHREGSGVLHVLTALGTDLLNGQQSGAA